MARPADHRHDIATVVSGTHSSERKACKFGFMYIDTIRAHARNYKSKWMLITSTKTIEV